MLVLTRKADEQILIGDDITLTLVRVRGNSVRIGIDAPREVRVRRGELARGEAARGEAARGEAAVSAADPVEREEVFARPDSQNIQRSGATGPSPSPSAPLQGRPDVLLQPASQTDPAHAIRRAPLSAFVSAT